MILWMMLAEPLTMLALTICVILVAFAVDSTLCLDLRPYNETALGMFLATDYNIDGQITCLELDASFDKYDTNHNGEETRHEYTEFICATNPALYQLSHYLFDEYDFNNDHHLRKEDYDALCHAMDTDTNGSVNQAEFISYWERIFPKYENVGLHAQTHQHGQSNCH